MGIDKIESIHRIAHAGAGKGIRSGSGSSLVTTAVTQ